MAEITLSPPIEPFSLSVGQSDLDDLHQRLRHTRWPDAETVNDTTQGPPLAKVQALCTLLARRL